MLTFSIYVLWLNVEPYILCQNLIAVYCKITNTLLINKGICRDFTGTHEECLNVATSCKQNDTEVISTHWGQGKMAGIWWWHINYLTPSDAIWLCRYGSTLSTLNRVMTWWPSDTKLLPGPMFTYHQRDSVALTRDQFITMCSIYRLIKPVRKIH